MDLGLDGAVALVAGSSRGLGRAMAWRFGAEGARVVVTGRDAERVTRTGAELAEEFGHDQVLTASADLTLGADVERVVSRTTERWGRIDVLVANVGSTAAPGWDQAREDWQRVLDANLLGSADLFRGVIPAMLQQGRGSIVATASIAGLEDVGAPVTYAAAKAALISSCGALARLLGPSQIRVNAVAPGNLLFPGSGWEKKLQERGDAVREVIRREVALQRFGTAEEVADVVAFLASPRAAFVTGACWVVDGGQTRRFA